MTDDPVRLIDQGGSDLLHSLVSAAREEAPEAAALQRTLIAAGVSALLTTTLVSSGGGSAAASASSATSATSASGVAGTAALGGAKSVATSTLWVVAKWLAVGAVTGTVASSAVYGVSGMLAPAPSARPAVSALQAAPVGPESPVPARAPSSVGDMPEIPAPPPAIVLPTAAAVAEPASAAPEAELGAPLAAEVAALDRARQALRAGNSAQMLNQLSGYEARFPEGRMLPEVLYLRLEAFTLQGDKSNAEAIANRILRVYPSSPHAARARAVLGVGK